MILGAIKSENDIFDPAGVSGGHCCYHCDQSNPMSLPLP